MLPPTKALVCEPEERPVVEKGGLLSPPLMAARRVLLCADSGYCHFVALIPRDARLDLDRLSRLMGGARLQIVNPECESVADFRLDTIVDAALAGHDFELELETGVETRFRYADFEQQCHPQVAAICLPAAGQGWLT